MTPRAYVICTAPRSGSTMLCGLLEATGVAGHPASHFHTPSLRHWLAEWGLADRSYPDARAAMGAVLSAARAGGTGPTGVFGLRMQGETFPYFTRRLAGLYPDLAGDRARIEAAFGPTVFVHLRRADTLGQAISRCRAESSGLWHRRADGSELERLPPSRPAGYDAGAIAAHLAALTALDRYWDRWFAAEGIRPLRVAYEDLAGYPHAILANVLAAIGADPGRAAGVAVPTRRLADGISRAWRARFLADRPDLADG